ncbi:SusC/RagA family TonB-linked outer membrane protein [Pedobacter gandavensis]|uniref:SusC/RagA family TonB-linked outer membrane protein n=1 Tax=Pedobacter gandavensis TaxID=2679963 RepID=UPI00247AB3C1|nr:SusC/RagA family TonB-linked outer membrane protein [Pedobacter gandavensis]WGQ07647.1 SusC/RagA family TonB-linked outer membrane protein [Pedobacter gandavensis]
MKMVRIIASAFFAVLVSALCFVKAEAKPLYTAPLNYHSILLRQDTVPEDSAELKRIDKAISKKISNSAILKGTKDSVNIRVAALSPNVSLQQMLKGNVAGVYVQETTGEPGAEQSMLIRGLSAPIFSRKDVYAVQPAVYLNGIPLAQDNPFAFEIQKYDFNRIGPATNLLSFIDINDVNSIEVIKDPVALAKLGPNAANGAIWVTTKNAKSGARQISLNSYFGMVQSSKVNTVNGAYENAFRQPFYQKYATADDRANYVGYLRDSTSTDYYGPSNWNDLYFKTAPVYSLDLSLTGGSERANFRFFGGNTRSAGNADETALNRYTAGFQINMAPFEWLTLSTKINATRLDRNRNRSVRDRFGETTYLTDFTTPLSPNKALYQNFLDEYKKVIDDNTNTLLQGAVALTLKLDKISFTTSVLFDYMEGTRDAFFPSTLMEDNNFVSNYFGFNQRVILNNAFSYKYDLNKDHKFEFELGQSLQDDTYKYNYAKAYNGPNDFIKINKVDGNRDHDDYLESPYGGFYVSRFNDREKSKLLSFYGAAKYQYKDLLTLRASVRNDGSSNGQPDSRWMITPAFGAEWSLKNQFLTANNLFEDLRVTASWSRIMKPFNDDRFAGGPQYRVNMGWNEEPTLPTYGGGGGIMRPYTSGWVGYGIGLPFVDQFNLGLDGSFLGGRLNGGITFYQKDDKRMVLNLPLVKESGYASINATGMDVRNTGVDLTLNAQILKRESGLNWTTGFNMNFNKNKLTALPNGLKELIIGDRLLKVGESIGAFWLYENKGIYNNSAEIPVNPANGRALTFDGNTLKAGDPIWKDQNGDFVVNDADKVLKGSRLPKFTAGWTNQFSYAGVDLTLQFFAAIGQKALNQYDASRYDFINRENSNNIGSIREVNSWQISNNAKSYTIYNPWSDVIPYRIDQDLFLENASYVKLRTVSLGYDLTKTKAIRNMKADIKRIYVYVTANNLLTMSPFTGGDPELIDYTGMYNGYGMAIPRTYTLGVKFDL